MSTLSEAAAAAAPTPPASVGAGRAIRLVVMMMLEFLVQGSWFATVGLMLATNGLPTIIGTTFTLAAVAAIISPMFLGALADRFFPSQQVLGVAHAVGGVIMLFLPSLVRSGRGGLVLLLLFVYCLFFQPTLGIANSIAFFHLSSNRTLFPYVRVFGTLGWVLAGVLVGALGLSASPDLFRVTAVVSLILGVYAFTLPNTPAPAKGVSFSLADVVGAKAFFLFRNRNFLVFFCCVFMTSISLAVYNSYASTYLGALGIENVAAVMSLGQLSEVVFILTIPWALKHLGMKWSLFGGMVMWGIRFALFYAASGGNHWMAVVAICLHGICNDFFLVVGAMYIDEVAPAAVRSQAQSLLIMAISGVGAVIGSSLAGQVYNAVVSPGLESTGASAFHPMFAIPLIAAAVTAVVWTGFFRYNRHDGLTPIPMPGASAD
ncbi:MFS transporter [Actinomyces oricola]|uniref:MFS transporter n=1 Tax=Actinomyces oricola TaxID=206043 RepID=UPI000FFEA010|nr:MFS transporter [Actinomyces oricola]